MKAILKKIKGLTYSEIKYFKCDKKSSKRIIQKYI